MTLAAGTRLGPNKIDTPLGAGGMGEGYKGRDTHLERSVAIKILPAHLCGIGNSSCASSARLAPSPH